MLDDETLINVSCLQNEKYQYACIAEAGLMCQFCCQKCRYLWGIQHQREKRSLSFSWIYLRHFLMAYS
jgi:hypothetical protein